MPAVRLRVSRIIDEILYVTSILKRPVRSIKVTFSFVLSAEHVAAVKVRFSAEHTMKAQRGVEVWYSCSLSLTLALDGLLDNSTPRPLYPRERGPGTRWSGGWVSLRVSLDGREVA